MIIFTTAQCFRPTNEIGRIITSICRSKEERKSRVRANTHTNIYIYSRPIYIYISLFSSSIDLAKGLIFKLLLCFHDLLY
ncbi:hypothetical protein QVD17_38707 [Tagetes erecta]|uniref:Uncharacterized protein n=1 Tax=Tagetes erecta TaxID=13708 RepID=A0AAD8JQZ3_TARER|nr:hypothetical protein QVD17_38707 [Tagetes erecta]